MSDPATIPPEREGRAPAPELAALREQMAQMVAQGAFDAQEPPVEEQFAGLRCLRFSPEGPPRAHVLQLHGGGFRIGRPEFESRYAHALSRRCGIEVLVPQYRLAPDAPFPAGFNDALAALGELRQRIGEGMLILGGDSAGAGLAASLAVHAAARGGPRIDAVVLLSAWLDLTVSAPSYDANAASDPMFSREAAEAAAELYLQGFDPRHPLVSPLLAELADFPPCFISVGTGEVLADDSRRFHEKLLAAGNVSRLSAIEGMDHVAVVRGFDQPGAAETFAAATEFIDGQIAAREQR